MGAFTRTVANLRTVAIVYRFLPQYRIDFYERLRNALYEENIELKLLYGDGDVTDRQKNDLVDISWGVKIPNRVWTIGSKKLYWQPAFHYLKNVDLIVVEQASRLILNYILLVSQQLGGQKVAFWGHGKNFQTTSANRLAECLKQIYSRYPHWWFAYNRRTAKVIEQLGYPQERVTIVNNAIDTSKLRAELQTIGDVEKNEAKKKYRISGQKVGIFLGGLYPEKRLQFLISAAGEVKKAVQDFELVIVGDGVERYIAETAAKRHSWIKYCGPCFGREKATILSLGRVLLMPGLVGLVVLDAFASGLPLLTTDVPYHSPEIEYLEHDKNGRISPDDLKRYSEDVVSVMRDDAIYESMRSQALIASHKYTIEHMVNNFVEGIAMAIDWK